MPPTPSPQASWPDRLAALAGVVASLGLGYAALALKLPPPAAPVRQAGAGPGMPPAPALAPCAAGSGGFWRGSISGTATLQLDWSGAALSCAGNARPGGRGLRLFFAGHPGAGADRLVIVIGLDAAPGDLAGREWPASVTVIDEASSSFFHSAAGRCFTRIGEASPLDAARRSFRIAGELYCAGAIAAVAGDRAITLGDTRYAGRLDLDAP